MTRAEAIALGALLAAGAFAPRLAAAAGGASLAQPRGGPLQRRAFTVGLYTRSIFLLPDPSNYRDQARGSTAIGVAFSADQVGLARTIALGLEPALAAIDALLADGGGIAALALAGDGLAAAGDSGRAAFVGAAQTVQSAVASIASSLRAFRTNPISGDYPYTVRIVTQLADAVHPDGTMPLLPRRYPPQAQQFQTEFGPLARQLSRWVQLCLAASSGTDVALAELADTMGAIDVKMRGIVRDASDAGAPPRLIAASWTTLKSYLLSVMTGPASLVDRSSWPATGDPASVRAELPAQYVTALGVLDQACTYLIALPATTVPGTGNVATLFIAVASVAGLLLANAQAETKLAPGGGPLAPWLAARLREDGAAAVNAASAGGPALSDYRDALQRLRNYVAAYPSVFS